MDATVIYIYGLIDPRDHRLRYIGKTPKLKTRYQGHCACHSGGTKVRAWIAELRALELSPGLIVLEETDEDHWREAEQRWITINHTIENDLLNTLGSGKKNRKLEPPVITKAPKISPLPLPASLLGKPPRTSLTHMTPAEICAYRQARNWSQGEFARALGLHYSTVSLWESGKRQPPKHLRMTLEKLSEQYP